jgi:glutamate--cysteine ligase
MPLHHDDVVPLVAGTCFKTGPPGQVGVELEWLVVDPANPRLPVSLEVLRAAVDAALPLPGGSLVTYEPGGQLELSSLVFPDLNTCWQAANADVAAVRNALARVGLRLIGLGIDPLRRPLRQVRSPRYDAMAAYFDRRGAAGPWMMCSTAAVQVCVDTGDDMDDARRRWQLALSLGPTIIAAFANSAVREGRRTGWCSTRQQVWAELDAARCGRPLGEDPVEAWARYVVDAPVMVLHNDDDTWIGDPGFSFREWLSGAGHRPPTEGDLAYHLTTLFPPVRPRGCLELRYIDAQLGDDWAVPLAVLSALFDDPQAQASAFAAVAAVRDRWTVAARTGLADPALRAAALACFTAALDALTRLPAHPDLLAQVEGYIERYVARGRCPADDALSISDRVQAEQLWSPA